MRNAHVIIVRTANNELVIVSSYLIDMWLWGIKDVILR